jgi:hypothetical protein
MDCSAFRDKHLLFIDDALDERDLVAMEGHLALCEGCRRHDTAVRRGMLLCRNLPEITPSADFQARLQMRLREARSAARGHAAERLRAPLRAPGLGLFAASVLGVFATGWLAVVALGLDELPRDLVLPPAVAVLPEPEPEAVPMSAPAVVASVSTGMPVWPAALAVEEMQQHFESAGFVLTSWNR